MEDLAPGRCRRGVDRVDLLPALDREREVVQARRVEVELLVDERLPQPERARARLRKTEVVDRLALLARHEVRRLEPERPEDGGIERERRVEVAADQIEVAEADEHQSITATGSTRLRGAKRDAAGGG